MGRLFCIIQLCSKCHQTCPDEREAEREMTRREEERPVKTEAVTGVLWPRSKQAGSHRKLEEAKRDSPLGPLVGGQFDKHFHFRPVRLMLNFCFPEP